jgi:hypothetical protein
MAIYRSRTGLTNPDQRASARVKIAIEARLRLTIGDRDGQLVDISETGARIALPNPPPEGAPVILLWNTHEVFCKVIWTAAGTCGLQFDRPIGQDIVLEAVGHDLDLPATAVANRNNIPMGQKRPRPASLG